MTAIDDFVEKYENKIDGIKSRPIRGAIRGFIYGISVPGFAIELIATRPFEKTFDKDYAAKACTIGMKARAYGGKDCRESGLISKEALARLTGIFSGVFLSVQTYFVPWIATGAVDMTNFYLRKKEKKRRKNFPSPEELRIDPKVAEEFRKNRLKEQVEKALQGEE